MKIILGKELDGEVYLPLKGQSARQGVRVLGPLGGLEKIEVHFGCAGEQEQEILRVACFEKALRGYSGPDKFYQKSFEQDSFSAATKLLQVRDTILMGSKYDFSFTGGYKGPSRLQALSKVNEQAEKDGLSPGEPERIKTVINIITQNLTGNPFKEIQLCEAKTAWPQLWRILFEELQKRGTLITLMPEPEGKGKGNLGGIQGCIGIPEKIKSLAIEEDSSVVHIKANNLFEAADISACIFQALQNKGLAGQTLIIRDPSDSSLDAALQRKDLPVCGTSIKVNSMPASQILPLYLNFLWKDADPHFMREYLLLPVSPIPGKLRWRLINTLCQTPGIESDSWKATIAKYLDELDTENREKAEKKLDSWLKLKNLKPGAQVKTSSLVEVCDNFKDWARKYACATDPVQADLLHAASQAELFAAVMNASGKNEYSKIDLLRLYGRILESTGMSGQTGRQLGTPAVIANAGAMLDEVDTLIWLGATANTVPLPGPEFLTREEYEALGQYGFERTGLNGSKEDLITQSESWRRAIKLAVKRVIFITPYRKLGEDEDSHPIWHEILACFKNNDAASTALEIQMTGVLETKAKVIKDIVNKDALETFTTGKKDTFRPLWNLSSVDYELRDQESPSSLESLIACPFQYTLERLAGINGEETPTINDDSLLYGTIAHHLLEEFLKSPHIHKQPQQIKKEIALLYDSYIDREISLLNQPGRDFDKEVLKQKIILAGVALSEILKANDFVLEEENIEKTLEATTPLGKIGGRLDLLVYKKNKPKQKYIIDIKYSKTKYQNKLTAGLAIQLAIYSKLAGPGWPPTAYFILNTAELLTTHPDTFEKALVIANGPKESEVWDKMEERLKLIRKDLKEGKIEIGLPENPYPTSCTYCDYGIFCNVDSR